MYLYTRRSPKCMDIVDLILGRQDAIGVAVLADLALVAGTAAALAAA
jgi:hypothetical protein